MNDDGVSVWAPGDTSGAGYAIYWANVNNKLVVAGDFVTDARRERLGRALDLG